MNGIRPARPADAEELGAVHAGTWRETYSELLPETVNRLLRNEARRFSGGAVAVMFWFRKRTEKSSDSAFSRIAAAKAKLSGCMSCVPHRTKGGAPLF